VTTSEDLWKWFDLIAGGKYAKRLSVKITMNDQSKARNKLHVITLHRALPIKFKAADFNAQANAVAIEELHLAHEGMELGEAGK
jgi:phage tail-like protein